VPRAAGSCACISRPPWTDTSQDPAGICPGATGARTAVGDAIIGAVRDGRIVLWKEYLDGRIFALQRDGTLPLDEGEEPFPWPRVP